MKPEEEEEEEEEATPSQDDWPAKNGSFSFQHSSCSDVNPLERNYVKHEQIRSLSVIQHSLLLEL